jgi:glucan 1,3-beta-glucosidase
VNLGGWLVLEPWITPSIFEPWAENQIVKDEFTFCQTLGKTEAESRLQSHWSSWITASDLAAIKNAGLNHVRIPIGYWAVSPLAGDPYVQGAYDYLGKALDWAHSNGLMVMIDLHGAPGSQNGFDNSGRKGAIDWTQGDTVTQTKTALNKIRNDHAAHPAVAAIELLNEPMGSSLDMDTVRQFYMDGWGNLESSHVAITIHDAFQGVTNWNNWGSGMWNLILDTHHYEIFDDGSVGMGIDEHISTACGFGGQMASNNKWTISGEWTGAITDCAKWLNGLGVGARYDGTYPGSTAHGNCDGKYTGTVAALGAADKGNLRKFIEAQLVSDDD